MFLSSEAALGMEFGPKTRRTTTPLWPPFLSLGYQCLRQTCVLFWSLFQDVILEGPWGAFWKKKVVIRFPLGRHNVCFIFKQLMFCEGLHFCRKQRPEGSRGSPRSSLGGIWEHLWEPKAALVTPKTSQKGGPEKETKNR